MIDEKKLIESIKDVEVAWYIDGNYTTYDSTTIMDIIEEQPRVGEWIPFKEREVDEEEREMYRCDMMLIGELPDEDEDILVTYDNGRVDSDTFLRDGYECYLDSGAAFVTEAIAWMPFPEAYKG